MIQKITLLGLLICFSATAQVAPTLITDLSDGNQYDGLSDMVLHNNTLYISNSDAGNILKVDIASPNGVPEVFIDNLSTPTGLGVVGNDLYFLQAANAFFAPNTGTLSKINLTNPAANPVVVTTGLRFPTEMEVLATKAYIVESILDNSFNLDHSELALVDFSGAPVKTILYDNFYSLDDIELHGNDLYLLEWKQSTDATSILKLNVASGTPGTPSLYYSDPQGYYPYKMEISNDKLYFNVDSATNAAVYSIDLSVANPTASVVAAPFLFEGNGVYVGEMIISSNNLYAFGVVEEVSETNYLIYKADLSGLGINVPTERELKVYPNPCGEILTVNGPDLRTPYSIYDVTGKAVSSGLTTISNTINTANLKSGFYYLSVEGLMAVKIVKR